MQVAFIGIGNMGAPMAGHIAKAGHSLTVYDTDPAKRAAFAAAHGCRAAQGLADLAVAEIVITMLPDGHVVRDVYLAAEQGGLAKHLRRGTLCVDMSSSAPNGTRELGEILQRCGLVFFDAPVSGAVPRAKLATLAIMVGGNDAAAIERAKPVLACMGNKLFETGPLGSGHALKSLNNFLAATSFAAAAEALLVGKRFGLDPTKMLEVINVSTGRNFMSEVVMQEHVVNGKFATGFALGLLAKDVGIAADLASDIGCDAPLMKFISKRWAEARDAMGGECDNSEAARLWDK